MWLLTVLVVLAAWTLLAFPLAVAIGRSFTAGSRTTLPDERRVSREFFGG